MEEAPVFEVNDFLVFYTEDFSALSEDSAAVYGQVTDVSGDTVSYRMWTGRKSKSSWVCSSLRI